MYVGTARRSRDGNQEDNIMVTKAKSNSIVTTTWDAATQTIGYKVLGVGELALHLDRISQANRIRGEVNGWVQRIVDAAAIPAEALPDGEEARVAQAHARAVKKHALMARLCEHYESGSEDWSPARDSSGPGLDSLLIRAVMEVTGKDETQVRTLIATNAEVKKVTPRAYLAVLGSGAKVAEVANRMRAEGTTIDADEELAGIMGGEQTNE